ncbi:SGNH/GDSL hydrolase family protein [bacterium]|nr:SGNH/GDSL hydrolase family protein [candidate division CSSED10-310 bacterium]
MVSKKSQWALVVLITMCIGAEVAVRLALRFFPVAGTRVADYKEFLGECRDAPYYNHPYLPYFDAGTRIHAHGLSARGEEYSFHRAPAGFRIVCLGGSTTAGCEPEQPAYPRLLAQLLRDHAQDLKIEVVNLGVAGWNSADSLVAAALWLGHLQPDVVTVHHGFNDINPRLMAEYVPDLSSYRTRIGGYRWSLLERLAAHSSLAALVLVGAAGEVSLLDTYMVRPESRFTDDTGKGPERGVTFERNLRAIVALARGCGAVAVVATMPYHPDIPYEFGGSDALLSQHNETGRRVAREAGAVLVDMDREMTGRHACFRDRIHVDQEGHAMKARLLYDAIVDYLPDTSPARTADRAMGGDLPSAPQHQRR